MKDLLNFAKKRKIKIIEDAAQAFGSKHKQKYGYFCRYWLLFNVNCKNNFKWTRSFIITNKKKIYDNLLKLKNNGLKEYKRNL